MNRLDGNNGYIVFLLTSLIVGFSLAAQAEPTAYNDNVAVANDLYMADSTVQVSTEVLGDAVVAGGSIIVADHVAEDLLAAGGTINITADVGDDIRAAGGSIAIVGDVGDDVIVAGGTVVIDSTSSVGGSARLAGGTVTVAGNIANGLQAAGETIVLAGTIGGDVELRAKAIEIKPDAVINGKLNYFSPDKADIAKSATINGEVTHTEMDFERFDRDGPGFFGSLVFYLSLAGSAFALFLLLPQRSIAVVAQLQGSPFKSLGVGAAALFSTPFIALMLLVSVIGLPLGFITLALYFVILIVGLLMAIIWVGELVFSQLDKKPDDSKKSRAMSIAAGALVLLVVDWIPFIGGLVFFVVFLMGTGGLLLALYHWYANRNSGEVSKEALQEEIPGI